jgi:hypothetical protein
VGALDWSSGPAKAGDEKSKIITVDKVKQRIVIIKNLLLLFTHLSLQIFLSS